MADEGLYIGVLNVLEWPKLINKPDFPPFEYDVMRTYLATVRQARRHRPQTIGARAALRGLALLPATHPPRRDALPMPSLTAKRTCRLQSRDGIHFDTGWAYSGRELVPHGRCREPPYCMPSVEVISGHELEHPAVRPRHDLTHGHALTHAQADAGSSVERVGDTTAVDEGMATQGFAPLAELCCPFDHGILVPAAALLTVGDEHVLYYEGRSKYHEARSAAMCPVDLSSRSMRHLPTFTHHPLVTSPPLCLHRYGVGNPSGIGSARWDRHRIVGIQRDPNASDGRQCGVVITKDLELSRLIPAEERSGGAEAPRPYPVHFTVNVAARKTVASAGGSSAPTVSSSLHAEVIVGCRHRGGPNKGGGRAHGRPLRTHSLGQSVPITGDSSAAVLRWNSKAVDGSGMPSVAALNAARHGRVRLRFVVCGEAKLFSFSVLPGPGPPPPPAGGSSSPPTSAGGTLTGGEAVESRPPGNLPQGGTPSGGEPTAGDAAQVASAQEQRLRDLQSHRVVYGRCQLVRPDNCELAFLDELGMRQPLHYERCQRGGDGCSHTMALPVLNEPIVDIESCQRRCRAGCPRCRFASLSWSDYACDCYVDCKVRATLLAICPRLARWLPALASGRHLIF